MNMRTFSAFCLAVILIGTAGGCSSDDSTIEVTRTEVEKQRALRESAFGSMAGAMDKAAGVEQLNQDRKRSLDDAIDNSDGG